AAQVNNPGDLEWIDPGNPGEPREPEPKPPAADRAGRLAEVESREQMVLSPLAAALDKHQHALERLSKEELAVFPKGKLGGGALAKQTARYNTFLKDQAAALRPCIKDALALARQREEFLQAKRKIMVDQPAAGDPPLEDYAGLLLTPDEIKDQGPRVLNAGSPRAAAQQHVQAAEKPGTLIGAAYAGT